MTNKDVLTRLQAALEARKGAPAASSYVASLYAKGLDAMAKKVTEEATEVVLAAKDGDADHAVREVADLWFHSLIVLAYFGRGADDVLAELARREGVSGHAEKAARKEK